MKNRDKSNKPRKKSQEWVLIDQDEDKNLIVDNFNNLKLGIFFTNPEDQDQKRNKNEMIDLTITEDDATKISTS